jgi:trimethylamine--corrinoid protein Co-methyltransferase
VEAKGLSGRSPYLSLIRAAENSIPVALVSVPMAGSTSPVTICGSLVQHTAETLSGVVISQLVNPGSPVIWGGAPGTTDMRWGTTPMGTNAEGMLINMAYCEIGKYLRIPTLAYMGLSDAKCSDSQAGLESAMGATLAVLAGINMISGAGMMDFIMTHSLEKLLIDNEICRMAHRLTKGITPRAERLAEDLFTEGLYEGTHFFTSPITMQWLRSDEYSYAGPVISKEDRQAWIEKGGTTAEQRAKEEVKRILACHKPEPLDRDIDKELLRIMTQNAKRYCMSELPLP